LQPIKSFWSFSELEVFHKTNSSINGLNENEAQIRLRETQSTEKVTKTWQKDVWLLLSQYKNPLLLLLIFAAILSLVLKEYSDSIIVLVVLLLSGILGFIQERNAGRAVEKLRALVHNKAAVRRNGIEKEISVDKVVTGDIVLLNAGDIIPADAFILQSSDLHVNESVLTGESFPAEKLSGSSNEDTQLSDIKNAVFKGTSVINGIATVLVINTGDFTELGKIATSLETATTVTEFEKGIIQFGYLLMWITIIIAGLILIINLSLHKPLIDSILFALALAVGLAPELLPAIVTITLSAGAKRMASKKVIVKKLSAIQNLGEINVLCSDKTGTITEGIVQLNAAVDMAGQQSAKVLLYAYLNASFETGFSNPLDEAIKNTPNIDIIGYSKCDEVPYDFIRKRLSVVVSFHERHIIITKGAVPNILEISTSVESADGKRIAIEQVKNIVEKQFEDFCSKGLRVIGVCYKDVTGDPVINKDNELEMIFLGFVVLYDPPKKGIIDSINELRKTGITLKIITGDNNLVAKYLATSIGLSSNQILTGHDLYNLTDEALQRKVADVDIYAEIVPAQKERIVKALQKSGNAVGYLGDGINDANALKAADVGISIDNAVDVAKEAADLVLLDRDINVIREGVEEGRKTFMNTLKYIFVTTSANFGNMFSMAIASLILPFLPLLPIQILLNNFLSDVPAISIASDNVDKELLATPRRWNMRYIKRFMIIFGLQSSLFDFATFGLLLYVYHASPDEFRTAWFMESLLTEILILLIIRTHRSFFKSKPSKYLLFACVVAFIASFIIPYLPVAKIFGLYPLPFHLFLAILFIILSYIFMAEITKRFLMRKI
jgi:Mg2+-importing ATPase